MWKVAGWFTVLFSVCAGLVGVLLVISCFIESENRVNNFIAGAVMISVAFSLGRLGWSLRSYGDPNRGLEAPLATNSGAEATQSTTTPPQL